MKFLTNYKGKEYFYNDKFIYIKNGLEVLKLAMFDRHFYKLKCYKKIPVLEIDGIRMQLVKDFENPLDYSRHVAKRLGIKKSDRVLDTCMGLGYTAIEASRYAKSVATCEVSNAVYLLAKYNPWSAGLFDNNNIEIIQSSISDQIKSFRVNSFDVVIHDPPRFSHAPELYSNSFYRELYRITRKNCRIYHYVGSVGKNKQRRIEDEVSQRLKSAGFKNIRYDKKFQGLFFNK